MQIPFIAGAKTVNVTSKNINQKLKGNIKMIWIIIGLIISFFIWQQLIHEKATKISFGECLVTILISSLVIVMVSIIPAIFVDYTDIKYSYNDLESSTRIIALKDNNYTEGQFFLGCGSINNSNYYCYYTETNNGDIEYNQISTNDNVKLRYCSNEEQPKVEVYNKVAQTILIKKPTISTSSFLSYIRYYKYNVDDVVNTSISPTLHQTIIYIPEESIQKEYNIDLE